MNQEKIGRFIAKCRHDKKLTQFQLGKNLGVTEKAVSNWENGRNLPDISLFKALCNELDITFNELLSGEKIKTEDYQKKCEENIVNTIDYTNKKITKKNNILGIILLIFGFLIILTAIAIFPSESSWSSIYSVLGTIVALIGFSYFSKKLNYIKRLIANILFFTIFILVLLILDYANVKMNKEAPRFSKATTTINTTILYDTLFYDVYRCNKDLENEFWVIERNHDYDNESIMNYCK